ncbi:MAG TPA: heparinase II/III family protein, partial [Pyrinomonadaceae bacterium]|nr:heparinase II/III family protein [Pyrinomonadaceae bacterium]
FAKLSVGLIAGVVICVFVQGNRAQSNGSRVSLTQPYSLRENFQGEGLGQWASYPPAQDIGYEPSLSPTTDYSAPDGRARMRIVKPNRVGPQRFGFIKKVRMILATDSKLRFAYQLKSPGPAAIEVGLAGVDGQLYTTRLLAKTNEWSTTDFTSREVKAKAGTIIEAIYIVAEISNANPDFSYRFIIDDVAVSGLRKARFEVTTPHSVLIDPWPALISGKSYRNGDTIALETRAPSQVTKAEFLLETTTGQTISTERLYDDGSHGDKNAGDDVWTNDRLYQIRSSDPSGVWLARLRGTTNNGESIATDVRLLVRPNNERSHPRLFFSASDREKLLARSRDPKLASLWANLQTTAKTARASGDLAQGGDVFELLDSENLLPSLLGYFDVLNRARSRIAYNALDAYLTSSAEARSAAKGALLDVARWKHWEPPWFRAHGQHTYYPAGQLAADVGFGYDLLYDDLTESERALVRKALIEKSIVPTFKEYVADNRVMANTSNWIAHTVGGALIAAASIADDVSEKESEGQFEIYVGGLMRKLEDHMAASYLSDGSYGEGISYHEFDAETLGPALVAVKRSFGANYWKQTHVLESLTYPLYTLVQPVTATPDMGDTHPPAGHGIPAIVYHSKDPVTRWYYSQFDRPSLAKFIFYDDSVPADTPKLPTSRIFDQKGNAVFRSGWGGDDLVLLFRAGPNFNHHHADQGSLLLSGFGEILISEAGWSDYYKDPYYATFFTQAIGHNTILVGGNPESQTIPDTTQFKALNRYPRITDSITSEFYDGVGSELSSVYQNRLASYVRRIVFVKPNYFVIFDDLKVTGAPEQIEFLLHLPNRDKIKVSDLTAIYAGEKASLVVRSFPSNAATLNIAEGRIPYQIFSARTPAEKPAQPAYLDFKTVKPVRDTQFLTAIVPARTQATAQRLSQKITEIAGEGVRGIRVERDGKKDLVLFRTGATGRSIDQDGWTTDAASLVITESGNNLEVFAVQEALGLRHNGKTLFSSETSMSVAARIDPNEVKVVCHAKIATQVTFFVGKTPAKVLIDGREFKASTFVFNASGKTVSLNMPSGQHDLLIMFR